MSLFKVLISAKIFVGHIYTWMDTREQLIHHS